ncbi:hypothetical protein, partial [Mesomycoplasma hyorhinis]
LVYSYDKEFGQHIQFKVREADTSLFYFYFSDDELKLYFGLSKEKIRAEYKKRIENFNKDLHEKLVIYIWMTTSEVYIGQSTDFFSRIYDHIKKEEIKKIWIFGLENSNASTDILKLIENKLIQEFENNNLKPKIK